MLYFDKNDVYEGIDVNEASASIEFITCHYFYFPEKGFRFQSSVCNWCHELMMPFKINNIAILNIHGANYCCIIVGISRN